VEEDKTEGAREPEGYVRMRRRQPSTATTPRYKDEGKRTDPRYSGSGYAGPREWRRTKQRERGSPRGM